MIHLLVDGEPLLHSRPLVTDFVSFGDDNGRSGRELELLRPRRA